ncbi:putative glutathione transferase [Helianthus annuus]|nr:putative glutathione transferase [Helianthus annuus]
MILHYIYEPFIDILIKPTFPKPNLKPGVTSKMADEVKLYEDGRSPYVSRVKLALHLKGVKYESVVEDLSNKSADLLKYNPVYKKVPVLVHNGNPISESLVIIEYIDNVWKGVPILPCDPYEKADARFWAKFIADTVNLIR